METIAARDVQTAELDRLDAVAASLGDQSPIRAALDVLVSSVRAGGDVVIAAREEQFTPRAAAELLGMSRTHLYKVMDAGDLRFVRVGRDRRIAVSDLVRFRTKRDAARARLAERFAHSSSDRAALVRDLAGVDVDDAASIGY